MPQSRLLDFHFVQVYQEVYDVLFAKRANETCVAKEGLEEGVLTTDTPQFIA